MRISRIFFCFVGIFLIYVTLGENTNIDTCSQCICYFYYGGLRVNCSNLFLRQIPDNIPLNVTILTLSRNNLNKLPKNVFMNLRRLIRLDLAFNYITTISEEIFEQNVMLQTIDLGVNRIAEIPEKIFKHNVMLHTILLNKNLLSYIPENIFANNINLTTLTLAGNKLQKLSNRLLVHNPALRTLDLSGNKLQTLSNGLLTHIPSLKTLKICSNELEDLPEMIFESATSLQNIDICNNHLKILSKSNFHGLNTIYTLIMYNNDISTLPPDLFSEVSLDGTVFLSYNDLIEIPMNLFCSNSCSHQLEWLFLHKNKLTFLHSNAFKGLQNMTHLFLHGNYIQSLGDDVFLGTKIQYIFMFSNTLTSVTNKSFHGINDSLLEIHIYKNNISFISNDALPDTEKKLTLFVDCEKLEKLPKLRDNTSIACVKNTMLPDMKIDDNRYIDSIKRALKRDAFNCTSNIEKYTSCRPCTSGTVGNGKRGCVPCPAGGFYQDEVGNRHCKRCKNGTFVRQSESKSSENCEVCPEGTDLTLFAGHRACFCKINYARTDRFKGCALCFEEGLNCTQDYKSLRPGYYWNWNFTGANITEYSNFVSLLQNDSAEFNLSNSMYKSRIPKVYPCPRRDSCANRNNFAVEDIQGNCEEGYRGWLCSICERRYYSMLNVCIPCPGQIWIVLEIIAILCLAAGLYGFISRQIKIDHEQRSTRRSLIDKSSSQMKIVLGFYQVIGELCESFYDANGRGPLQVLGKIMSFIKLNVLRVFIRPHCYSENLRIDVKRQLIICLIFPVVLGAFLLCCYAFWKLHLKYKMRYQKELEMITIRKVKDRLLTYALFLLFITYPPTCDVIFKLYPGACKMFYIYDNDTNVNITLLRADFDINCDTLQAYQSLAYVATVCYVLAFPCTLFFLLRKHCKKNFIMQFDDENLNNHELQCYCSTKDNTCLVKHKPVHANIPVWLKFLCENYKPEFWYWETVELARKVTQTVLVTLLGWEDALTKLLTISISVLFLTLHAKLSPMTNNFEQRLQMFSLAAIFINVLVASVPIPDNYQAPISTVLIILNMIIIITVTVEVVIVIFRFLIRRRKYFRGTSKMERE